MYRFEPYTKHINQVIQQFADFELSYQVENAEELDLASRIKIKNIGNGYPIEAINYYRSNNIITNDSERTLKVLRLLSNENNIVYVDIAKKEFVFENELHSVEHYMPTHIFFDTIKILKYERANEWCEQFKSNIDYVFNTLNQYYVIVNEIYGD